MISIITGDIDSGKTSYLKNLYEKDKQGDGILSLKHYENGRLLGYDVLHLKSGKKKAFIRLKTCVSKDWDGELEIGKYSVSKKGLQFAQDVLRKIEEGPIFIDEIGPIEIWHKEGYYEELKNILQDDQKIYLTLRPTLIDEFHDEFKLKSKTKIITLK